MRLPQNHIGVKLRELFNKRRVRLITSTTRSIEGDCVSAFRRIHCIQSFESTSDVLDIPFSCVTEVSVSDAYAVIESRRTLRKSRQSSREVAYDAIKRAILAGQFSPYERLVEERLAGALDISRTPVREALAILEHEGLLDSEPYKGLAVRPVTVGEFLDMYEALGVIEAVLARAAAVNATASDIRRMDEALQRAAASIPDNIPEHLAANREFQAMLGAAADRPYLTRMLLGIEERSDMYLIHSGLPLPVENLLSSVEDRSRILGRVQNGDAEGAAAAAMSHAEGIRTRWPKLYPDASP